MPTDTLPKLEFPAELLDGSLLCHFEEWWATLEVLLRNFDKIAEARLAYIV